MDNDGDLDIVTNDFNSEPQVLVSDLAQRKKIHWLKIVLEGTRSNRNGLGATVRMRSGGQTHTKYNDGKSGYLAQSVLPLYFGLGDVGKIDWDRSSWSRELLAGFLFWISVDRIHRGRSGQSHLSGDGMTLLSPADDAGLANLAPSIGTFCWTCSSWMVELSPGRATVQRYEVSTPSTIR